MNPSPDKVQEAVTNEFFELLDRAPKLSDYGDDLSGIVNFVCICETSEKSEVPLRPDEVMRLVGLIRKLREENRELEQRLADLITASLPAFSHMYERYESDFQAEEVPEIISARETLTKFK